MDFVKPATNSGNGDRLIFRTHVEHEKGKLIFQIGTASPELAVEAANIVVQDVAGIDINAGCPKHFSIHSGMGAALLQTPDKLVAILKALVTKVGGPNSVPISVKIRLLGTTLDTQKLVTKLCDTGIARITVHCRTTSMRPRQPAIRDHLQEIVNICHNAGVQCFANGDIISRTQAIELMNTYNLDGCMIARAAEENPSVFRLDGALPWKDIAKEYLQTCIVNGNAFSNTKFCLSHLVPGKAPVYERITRSKSFNQLCDAFGMQNIPHPFGGWDIVCAENLANVTQSAKLFELAEIPGKAIPVNKSSKRELSSHR